MMKLLQLLMKRPTDTHIRYAKIILGVILILTGIVAFNIQHLELENSIFGIPLDTQVKQYLTYIIISLGAIPLLFGGLDINILSRGRTRILQILFAILLFIIGSMFTKTATLSVDFIYFILGSVVAFFGITGKAITKKGLKHGQKITKIRV